MICQTILTPACSCPLKCRPLGKRSPPRSRRSGPTRRFRHALHTAIWGKRYQPILAFCRWSGTPLPTGIRLRSERGSKQLLVLGNPVPSDHRTEPAC